MTDDYTAITVRKSELEALQQAAAHTGMSSPRALILRMLIGTAEGNDDVELSDDTMDLLHDNLDLL